MKKIALAVFALALAPVTYAGQLAASDTPTPQTVTSAANCTLLSQDITVSLSKSVAGGYECDADTNVIAVSTCNPNGKKTGTNNNFYTSSGAGGSVTVESDAACTAGAAETKAQTKAGATS